MTAYLEVQAALAPKQSLQHYAEVQRRTRRGAGERQARRRLPRTRHGHPKRGAGGHAY
jgi:hypothetical protein